MPDVRMPDGTIIRNVPDGMTKSELMRRVGTALPPEAAGVAASPTAPSIEAGQQQETIPDSLVISERSLRGFLNNVIGLPQAAMNASGTIARGVGLTDASTPQLPDADDLVAAQRALFRGAQGLLGGEVPDMRALFESERDQVKQRFDRQKQESPVASGFGDVVGDAATIAMGRIPIRAAIARNAPQVAPKAELAPGIRRQLDDIVRSKFSTSLRGGLKKAAETGAEGMALSVLQDGDPLETAAWAAGGQTAGSLAMTLARHPVKALAPTVIGSIAAIQLFKVSTPGGKDFVSESSDEAFKSVRNILGTAAVSALAGMGRVKGRTAENLPKVADAITAVPRGMVLSLIEDLTTEREQGGDTTLRVMEIYGADPKAFGPLATERLERAIKNGKVSKEIERLMEVPSFRSRFEALTSQP